MLTKLEKLLTALIWRMCVVLSTSEKEYVWKEIFFVRTTCLTIDCPYRPVLHKTQVYNKQRYFARQQTYKTQVYTTFTDVHNISS